MVVPEWDLSRINLPPPPIARFPAWLLYQACLKCDKSHDSIYGPILNMLILVAYLIHSFIMSSHFVSRWVPSVTPLIISAVKMSWETCENLAKWETPSVRILARIHLRRHCVFTIYGVVILPPSKKNNEIFGLTTGDYVFTCWRGPLLAHGIHESLLVTIWNCHCCTTLHMWIALAGHPALKSQQILVDAYFDPTPSSLKQMDTSYCHFVSSQMSC